MTFLGIPLTLGVEEEYQIVNPQTRNLDSFSATLLSQDEQRSNPLLLKPEFMQSQVEVGSEICADIKEVRSEIVRLRREVCKMAEDNGVQIAAASTHPFARWEEQAITEGERYREMVDDMQGVARRLLIFGMHVHVGFGVDPEKMTASEELERRNFMIDIMNQVRYFIPHLLALSTSSPFWHGRNSGLKSYRSVVFEGLPRTGIPHSFVSWPEYYKYERTLEKVGAFGNRDKTAKIWWDIRPHPKFHTLEFRIADVCTKVDEAVCLSALFQAICAKLVKLRQSNLSWRPYRHMHVSENKWRAVRYGISNTLIDFGREKEVPFNVLLEEILALVDDVVDELGSRKEVEYARTILANGTSADRQLAVYEAAGGEGNSAESLKAVVDSVVAETKEGLF